MNLRKDAWIACSLAGAVLVLAGLSTQIGRAKPRPESSVETLSAFDPEVFQTFSEAERAKALAEYGHPAPTLVGLREHAMQMYNGRPMKSPLDLYRLSAILESSEDSRELALSHRLSVEALAGGVQEARNVVLRSQDRLLLSLGKPQRYGTQSFWMGRPLISKGEVTEQIPPGAKATLGIGNPNRRLPIVE